MRRAAVLAIAAVVTACAGTPGAAPTVADTRPSTTVPASATVPMPTTSTTVSIPLPVGVDPESACWRRAEFGDPASSEYVLPYPVGEGYFISQSYCFSNGGHRDQLAYDFVMPVGEVILAARGGVVLEVREDSPDSGDQPGEHNYLRIRHDDGSVALYAHLHQDGVLVDVGQRVEAFEQIALSGNSGMTARPHLHFGVYRGATDIPVNFRNAEGLLDAWGGLQRSRRYVALPDSGLPGG